MCILKVIDFWGCLYMLTLGLKLCIYLYHDFFLISSSRAMKIEANSILVYCKHAFSEAKGWNDRRIIRLDNYWRKGQVCLICCLRVGMGWDCWNLFKMQWVFVPKSMPRVKMVQHFSDGTFLHWESFVIWKYNFLWKHFAFSNSPDATWNTEHEWSGQLFIPAAAQEAGAALWLWGLPRVSNFRSDRLNNPNPWSTFLTFRSCIIAT